MSQSPLPTLAKNRSVSVQEYLVMREVDDQHTVDQKINTISSPEIDSQEESIRIIQQQNDQSIQQEDVKSEFPNNSLIKDESNDHLKKIDFSYDRVRIMRNKTYNIRPKDDTQSFISNSQYRIKHQVESKEQSLTQTKAKNKKSKSKNKKKLKKKSQIVKMPQIVRTNSRITNKVPEKKQPEDDLYNLKLFDNLDNIIVKQEQFLKKQKLNYEKILIRMYNLDALKSQKAQQIIDSLNQTNTELMKIKQKAKPKKTDRKPRDVHQMPLIERNQSLPTRSQESRLKNQRALSKQQINTSQENLNSIKRQLNQVQEEIQKQQIAFEEVRYKPEFNVSVFKFQPNDQVSLDQWERLVYNKDQTKIKSKISNFDDEMEKVLQMHSRNDKSLNQYLNIQNDLINYKNKIKLAGL